MAKQSDRLASAAKVEKKSEKTFEKTGSPLSGLFAEENEFDRRALWRIGSWGVAAVGAVTLAVMSNQWSLGMRREQLAAADLARQAQQIQALTKESQNETRRLASAVETLNNDRDRLFSRVTVIEQGLDSVTGALAKQATPSASPGPQASAAGPASNMPQTPQQNAAAPVPAPVLAPVASTAAAAAGPDRPRADAGRIDAKPDASGAAATATTATASPGPGSSPASGPASPAAAASLMTKSIMGPPDPAAPKLVEAAKPSDMKAAEAKVDARLDAKADGSGPDAGPAAASEVVASATAIDEPEADAASVAVKRTDFAVDLGSANSLSGLRALWRGVRHVNAELGALNPIVVIREGRTGLGMQLHLAAGPLKDAAAAAKICAVLTETKRSCETTVYDGQRLAMKSDETQSLAAIRPGSEGKSDARGSDMKSSDTKASDARPAEAKGSEDAKVETRPGASKRSYRHARKDEPPAPPPKPESTSTFSSLFGRK
ncbi:MAG TPA: hypothetical protein VKY22_10505 [Bradyrhizobium sp.]|nr:hypothetical protein [Bradyrhizobium sp.]